MSSQTFTFHFLITVQKINRFWCRQIRKMDKCVRCSCQIFTEFNIPKIIKIGSFLTELFKNLKEMDVFWRHSAYRIHSVVVGAAVTRTRRVTTSSFPISTWNWWTVRCVGGAAPSLPTSATTSCPMATSSESRSNRTTPTTPPASPPPTSSANTKVRRAVSIGLRVIDRLSCGFTSHSTQNRSLRRRFAKLISCLGIGKKLNLTQQKHAFANQKKRTTTQNKRKKTKYARFSRLLRHPAWKRSGSIHKGKDK